MLKVVYSLWFSHIFSYEIYKKDEWHERNKDWTFCMRRYGEYFFNIKASATYDNEHLLQQESQHKKIYIWKIYLEKFFDALGSKYLDLVEEFIAFTTFVQEEIERENQITTRRRKPCETYIQSSYTDANKDKFNTLNKNTKSKNDRALKRKRHDAERKWNEIFYQDIEKQQKIKEIEFVNEKKPTDQLHEASKKYYRDRNRLKKRNFINHFGELQKIEHYLAYYEDGQADVLDEDWFYVQSDDDDETASGNKEYRITPSKFKHIRKNPNKRHALSVKDTTRIKKHCDRIKGLCDIKSIKRININVDIPDIDKRMETVQFFEEKNKGNETEYVTHISCSKYEFKGVDRFNWSHNISKDWVELNFKKKDPQFYKEICSLKVGETVRFSPGSSEMTLNKLIVNDQDRGYQIKFIQGNEPSCLFLSLANTFDILGEQQLSLKLVQVFSDYFNARKDHNKPSMKDILLITKSNKYHLPGERKFKFVIQKIKYPINSLDILESDKMNRDIIYHCVLTNTHSICLAGTMIIDPVCKFTLPREEKYLRLCAELTEDSFDETKNLIYQCYKYTKIQRKK